VFTNVGPTYAKSINRYIKHFLGNVYRMNYDFIQNNILNNYRGFVKKHSSINTVAMLTYDIIKSIGRKRVGSWI